MIRPAEALYTQRLLAFDEALLREGLARFGSLKATAEWLGLHQNTVSRKAMACGITDAELRVYRERLDKAKYGQGWSGGKHGTRQVRSL